MNCAERKWRTANIPFSFHFITSRDIKLSDKTREDLETFLEAESLLINWKDMILKIVADDDNWPLRRTTFGLPIWRCDEYIVGFLFTIRLPRLPSGGSSGWLITPGNRINNEHLVIYLAVVTGRRPPDRPPGRSIRKGKGRNLRAEASGPPHHQAVQLADRLRTTQTDKQTNK